MNKYLRQVFISVSYVLILVTSVCSYQTVYSVSSYKDKTVTTANSIVQSSEKGVIKLPDISKQNIFWGYLEQAIKMFNATYPQVKVEINTTDSDIKTSDYSTRLNTEVMAGKGPDVFWFCPDMPISIYKIMDAGVLADINKYIESDKSFKSGDYFKVIMDSGVYKGKRYIIPLYFTTNMFLTTDEILKKCNFKINLKHWTIKDIGQSLTVLNKKMVNGKKVYFTDISIESTGISFASHVLNSSGINLIDHEKCKAYFNTPEFIELLNIGKILNYSSLPIDIKRANDYNLIDIMMKNQLLTIDNSGYSLNMIFTRENMMRYYFGSKVKARLYPYPTNISRSFSARPVYMVSISNNCRNKKLAYSFIRVLLSEDIQSIDEGSPSSILASIYFPVIKKAYNKLLMKYSGSEGNTTIPIDMPDGSKVNFLSKPLSPLIINDLSNIMSNIKKCDIQGYDSDFNLKKMMVEVETKYYQGKCTAKDAAKELQNRVTLYLNE